MNQTSVPEMPLMLTPPQLAKKVNMPLYYIRALSQSGKIKTVPIGTGKRKKILINYQSFVEYHDHHRSCSVDDVTSDTTAEATPTTFISVSSARITDDGKCLATSFP